MGSSESMPLKLNDQEKDRLYVSGYRLAPLKCFIATCAAVMTFGVLFLILLWRRDLKMKLFYRQCPLQVATKVKVKDSCLQVYIEDVVATPFIRYFVNKKIKYIWDDSTLQYTKLGAYDEGMSCDMFHANPDGLKPALIGEMERIYGDNLIEIGQPSTPRLIREEISNPFYFFQFYIVFVWMLQEYFEYSSKIIVLSAIAVGASVWETRKHLKALREKVQLSGNTTVIRGGAEMVISTELLVPGDVICIHPSQKQEILCDAVLIEGSCSMDESILTGESYPVTKLAVPNDGTPFHYDQHRRHLLFSGTQLIQGRAGFNKSHLKAVVIRTGFMTCKGELVRAILFPKPASFHFYHDILKCAMLLGCIGIGGTVYSTYVWIRNGGTVKEIILNSLDVASFVVPPSLPAALTCVSAFAQRRLKKERIFCLSSRHIIQSGGIDVVCFDKTGTLTETDMELQEAVPIQQGRIQHPLPKLHSLPQDHPLLVATASCHSLIRVDHQLIGYSIDRKMFQATRWILKNGPAGFNSDYGIETPILVSSPIRKKERLSSIINEVAVLKQFPFESAARRMTVITQQKGSNCFTVFIKGAPETIASLCNPETVPAKYKSLLKHYTKQGYRVLALAVKELSADLGWDDAKQMSRNDLELRAELIGFLIVRNQLKKETKPTIGILHEAQIKTAMVTGDNLQTAVTVARECAMVYESQVVIQIEAVITANRLKVSYKDISTPPEFISKKVETLQQDTHNGNYCFALDGSTFNLLRMHDLALFQKVIHRAKVFARMAPEDKQYLIESLQKIGRRVAMVGDGCNDCGALKTADTGLALSMADASVAAPFTSQEMNISSVLPLIREGRTTLESAFGTFQFATAMSLFLFVGVLMLYSISTKPSDFQYYIFDIGIITVPFFTLGNSPPSDFLHPRKPFQNLWGFLPIFSLFTFVMWQAVALFFGWFYCHAQYWFVPYVFEAGVSPTSPSYEETTIYWLMCIGSITAVFVYAPSEPYSKNIFRNYILLVWSLESTALTLCIMFITDESFVNFLDLKPPPHVEYSLMILLVGATFAVWCYIWEKYFIRGLIHQLLCVQIERIRPSGHQHEEIEKSLLTQPNWPKLGEPLITGEELHQETVQLLHYIPVDDKQ